MGSTYTAAVVGLGHIGSGYDLNSTSLEVFSHTKAYLEHPGFRLVGGVDTNSEKRKIFEDFSKTPSFGTVADLFEAQENSIDCISVCTPTEIHWSTIESLLNYKIQLILLEKPLASNLEKAQQILDSLDKTVRLAVNYFRRWDPAFLEIKNFIENKILGEPTSITCLYGKGLLNYASHAVDLLHFWFGNEKESMCFRSTELENNDTSSDFLLRFETFDAFFHCLDNPRHGILEMDMIFTQGRIKILKNGWDIQLFYLLSKAENKKNGAIYDEPRYLKHDLKHYQYNVIDGLYRHLKNRSLLVSDGQSAMATLKTCLESKLNKYAYK